MKAPSIKTSADYSQFSTILGNRIVNEKKVENLMNDITSGINLLPYCPVIVFEKEKQLNIVDGQHRFEATKRLELPVHYVVCEELDLKKIARLNSRSDKWTAKDFLDCYVRLGVQDYIILKEFMAQYELIFSTSIDLLMSGKISKGGMDIFRDGEFKVNFQKEAEELAELTEKLFKRYSFSKDRNLMTAVQTLQNKGLCDFEHLLKKIDEAPNEMDQQSSPKLYIFNIERVYNFKCSKRTVIF